MAVCVDTDIDSILAVLSINCEAYYCSTNAVGEHIHKLPSWRPFPIDWPTEITVATVAM